MLGRKLQPFCLYHALILAAEDSPFIMSVSSEEGLNISYSLTDLEVAVWVCSHPNPSSILAGKLYDSNLPGWLQKLKTWAWGSSNRRRARKNAKLLNEEGAKFESYLSDCSQTPTIWTADSSNSVSKAPWVLANFVFIQRHMHYSEHEVMSMKLGKLIWIAATLGEQLGSSSETMTPEEEEAIEALNNMTPEDEAKLIAELPPDQTYGES